MENEEIQKEEEEKPKNKNGALWDLLHNMREKVNFESPVNLNIANMKEIRFPDLIWQHYDVIPKKVKLTNNGNTVILSVRFFQDRPYITGGPLIGNYIFSQIHFHWGCNDMEGSEHTIDGTQYPIEMHIVHFKSTYLTQESALTEKDGVVVLVYFFKLQSHTNPAFEGLISSLRSIRKANSSVKLDTLPLDALIHTFSSDYFIYWGNITTSTKTHTILWIICREPFGISAEQTTKFRKLRDIQDEPLVRTFRTIESTDSKQIYHVNPSASKYSTLLPIWYNTEIEKKRKFSKRLSK